MAETIPATPRRRTPRRAPDVVLVELATALAEPGAYEFKPLFMVIYASLRARKLVSGGEEMLRLRTYEKLQMLVSQGMVKKTVTGTGKLYSGGKGLAELARTLAEGG